MRKRIPALLLCVLLAWEWAGVAAVLAATAVPEPCLLLKFSAPSVGAGAAKERLEPLPTLLLREVGVRWVSLPAASEDPAGKEPPLPEAADAGLRTIAGMIADAGRLMDRVETAEAAVRLSGAEAEVRKYRLGSATRPFLAEIFLRRGILSLWEGDAGRAEELFSRSRSLRPDFTPDPALFSPRFRDAWTRAGERPPPDAELLVHSLPSGADILVDGQRRGVTPARIRVPAGGPVRIRLERAGYRPRERSGQWFPGDSEVLEITLPGDPAARLGERLFADRDGRDSGPLIAEAAAASGARRVCLLLLEEKDGRLTARLLSTKPDSFEPALVGEFDWPGGQEGAHAAAARIGAFLRSSGWPAAAENGRERTSPWYHKWWFWVLLGTAAAGTAGILGAGGGGSTGSSPGASGVNF